MSMSTAPTDIGKLLDTFPVPAFIALYDGSITYANRTLAAVTGQPAPAAKDRTLFGLGIFHNSAEYRGFLKSFKHGGLTRRLVLPAGRLDAVTRPIILHASQVSWRGVPALCGVLSRNIGGEEEGESNDWNIPTDTLLAKLGMATLRVDPRGQISFMSQELAQQLGLQPEQPPPSLARIDVENDPASLARLMRQAQSHGSRTYETTFQRQDGTVFPVDIHLAVLSPPGRQPHFLLTCRDLTDAQQAQRELQRLEIEQEKLTTELQRKAVLISERYHQRDDLYQIISQSPAYRSVLRKIEQVAKTDTTVLITGETGTGKELIARTIHGRGKRASRPMVILNCGALPAELIESELFGYRKGAFTGARNEYIGRFELADEGTLFLDEIGEMPIHLQTRLLRVLQDGEITPLGAKQSISTNVRIIAATNRNLKERIREGKFRADLYFRLNVFPIHSIPLRERTEDIPLLIDHFIDKYASPDWATRPKVLPYDLDRLRQYPFTGNVRELENIVQRALIVNTGETLNFEIEPLREDRSNGLDGQRKDELAVDKNVLNFEEAQRQHIRRVLRLTNGKVSGKGGAAELLGMKTQTLFSKLRKLGIDRKKV